MLFTKKLTSIAGALFLAGTVYASQEAVCPSLDAIKAQGISAAQEFTPGFFYAYDMGEYNTENLWGFLVAPIEADSSNDAIEIANDVLDGMTAPGIPEKTDEDKIICMYNTGQRDLMAAAVTLDEMMSPSQLKKYIRHMHK